MLQEFLFSLAIAYGIRPRRCIIKCHCGPYNYKCILCKYDWDGYSLTTIFDAITFFVYQLFSEYQVVVAFE